MFLGFRGRARENKISNINLFLISFFFFIFWEFETMAYSHLNGFSEFN